MVCAIRPFFKGGQWRLPLLKSNILLPYGFFYQAHILGSDGNCRRCAASLALGALARHRPSPNHLFLAAINAKCAITGGHGRYFMGSLGLHRFRNLADDQDTAETPALGNCAHVYDRFELWIAALLGAEGLTPKTRFMICMGCIDSVSVWGGTISSLLFSETKSKARRFIV